MSLYAVDKVLAEVGGRGAGTRAFLADPEGYVRDLDLEPEERRALLDIDYATLWSMGAHPFILYGFVRSVLTARGQDGDRVTEQYKATVARLGRPSYET